MTRTEAIAVQKEIEKILIRNNAHYKVEYVRSPSLKFVNMEISIKVTKE